MEWIVTASANVFELLGIGSMLLGTLVALVLLRADFRRGTNEVFRGLRLRVARGILLGLEFLVAADILRTIATITTFRSIAILAAVVAIRTFLSFSLELEIEGRWPWQGRAEKPNPAE